MFIPLLFNVINLLMNNIKGIKMSRELILVYKGKQEDCSVAHRGV